MIRSYPTGYSLSSFSNRDEEMVVGEREETNTSEDPPSSPIISYIIQEEVQVEEDYNDIVDGEQRVSWFLLSKKLIILFIYSVNFLSFKRIMMNSIYKAIIRLFMYFNSL